jgi:hypothetical protein
MNIHTYCTYEAAKTHSMLLHGYISQGGTLTRLWFLPLKSNFGDPSLLY